MAAKDGTLRKRNTFDSCHARAAFVRTLVVDCRLGILGNGTSSARWDDRGPADPKPRGPPRVPPRARPAPRRAGPALCPVRRPRTPPPLRVTAGRLIPSGTEASQLPLLLLKTWSIPRCTLHCTTSYSEGQESSGQRTAMLSEPQRQEPLPDRLVVDSLDLYTAVEECHWAGAQALKFLAQGCSVACKLTDNRHLP